MSMSLITLIISKQPLWEEFLPVVRHSEFAPLARKQKWDRQKCLSHNSRMSKRLGSDSLLCKYVRGNLAQVPHNAEPGHDFERVISDVNLPPEESLPSRSHQVMMVIVPALA